jgi:hypothetical protein
MLKVLDCSRKKRRDRTGQVVICPAHRTPSFFNKIRTLKLGQEVEGKNVKSGETCLGVHLHCLPDTSNLRRQVCILRTLACPSLFRTIQADLVKLNGVEILSCKGSTDLRKEENSWGPTN